MNKVFIVKDNGKYFVMDFNRGFVIHKCKTLKCAESMSEGYFEVMGYIDKDKECRKAGEVK